MRRTLTAVPAAGLAGWSLLDAARRGDYVWDTAGVSKRRWIAFQLLAPGLGSALYLRRVRPSLIAAEQAIQTQGG